MRLIGLAVVLVLRILAPLAAEAQQTFSGSRQAILF